VATALDTVNLLRVFAGIVVLGYASYTDLVARRVKNEVWLALGGFGLVLIGADALLGELRWQFWLGSLGIIALAYVLWYVRLLYGGADAKAMMALALLLPYRPADHVGTWGLPSGEAFVPTALTTLTNGVALMVLFPLLFAAYNLLRGHVAVPAMFVGRKMGLEDAANSPVWIMEQVDETGAVKRRTFPRRDVDPKENAARLLEAGITEVWVTPKVPFMIPLTVGYLLALGVGDVVFQVVAKAMGVDV
jgi:preflagellin peptidase FlaK